MKKSIVKKLYSNNKGTTMVETIVSFTVLVIILAVIYQMIAYCSNMKMNAEDVERMTSNVNKALYKESVTKETDMVEAISYATDASVIDRTDVQKGPLFYMYVDTSEGRTDATLNKCSTSEGYRIWFTNLNATGFKAVGNVSDDPDAEGSSDQIPSVLSFKYVE